VIQTLPKEIQWAGRCYSDDILSQTAAFRDVGSHQKMIVHADASGPRVAKCVTEYIDDTSLKRAPHPPYSLDLVSSDFNLF
jgi:acetoacetate decarboxylase